MVKIIGIIAGFLFNLFIFIVAISVSWWLLKLAWLVITQGIDGFTYKP